MRKRTLARELALQSLYQLDLRGGDAEPDLGGFLEESTGDSEVLAFARELTRGSWERRDAIDRELAAVAENWDLKRMAPVDRNILRLGAYELLYQPETPPSVSINEAVDLAKKFSTAQSGAFVNGILDKVRARRCSVPSS